MTAYTYESIHKPGMFLIPGRMRWSQKAIDDLMSLHHGERNEKDAKAVREELGRWKPVMLNE